VAGGRQWAFLAALSDDDRQRVLAATRRCKFGRGEVLFHEGDLGDTFHLIDSGHVAIRTMTPNGDVVTLTVLGPGDCFGEQALLHPAQRRTGSAVALERAETLTLQRDEFTRLRTERPSVNEFFVDVLAGQVRRMTALLVDALYASVDTRVIRRLAALAEMYRLSDATTIPLTQEDVATLAGVTRSTANRVLRRLASEGVIALSRGHIEILQPEELAQRAR
jgi:CRP-like cAMP-binding protein